MEETHRTRNRKKAQSFYVLSDCTQISTYSPAQKLSEPFAFGFLWKLHYDCLHHWQLSIQLSLKPLSPPRGLSVGQESKVKVLVAQSCPTLGLHGLQPIRLLSMEFSMQVYWNGLPFPSPGDLPNWGLEPASPVSPTLEGWFLTI